MREYARMATARVPTHEQLAAILAAVAELDVKLGLLATGPPLLLDRAQAAARLGIGDTTLRQLAYAGQLEAVYIGHRMLFPSEGLADYVARLRLTPAGQDVGPPIHRALPEQPRRRARRRPTT